MRRIILLLISGVLFLTFQTTVVASLPIQKIRPDILLILTLYLSLSSSPFLSGILAFFMGYLVDLFSGNSLGLYAFSRPFIFYAAKLYKDRFYLEGFPAQSFFVFIFSLAEGLLTLVLLRVFVPVQLGGLIPSLLTTIVPQSVLSGLVAPLLFFLFDKGSFSLLGPRRVGVEERE